MRNPPIGTGMAAGITIDHQTASACTKRGPMVAGFWQNFTLLPIGMLPISATRLLDGHDTGGRIHFRLPPILERKVFADDTMLVLVTRCENRCVTMAIRFTRECRADHDTHLVDPTGGIIGVPSATICSSPPMFWWPVWEISQFNLKTGTGNTMLASLESIYVLRRCIKCSLHLFRRPVTLSNGRKVQRASFYAADLELFFTPSSIGISSVFSERLTNSLACHCLMRPLVKSHKTTSHSRPRF